MKMSQNEYRETLFGTVLNKTIKTATISESCRFIVAHIKTLHNHFNKLHSMLANYQQ